MTPEPWYLMLAVDQDGSGVKQWLFRQHPFVSREIDSREPLAPVAEIVAVWDATGLAPDGTDREERDAESRPGVDKSDCGGLL